MRLGRALAGGLGNAPGAVRRWQGGLLPVNATTSAQWGLRVLVIAIGLFAALVWGSTFVLLCSADPATPSAPIEPAATARPLPVAPVPRANESVGAPQRDVGSAHQGLPDPGPAADADAPMAVDELPADLRKDVQAAVQFCWHACERLGIPIAVDAWPRLRPSAARSMVRREAELKQELLQSALREQRLLSSRLAADPTLGIRVPAAERGRLQVELQKRYPGWPDGYRFVEESDGLHVHIAAWKVDGDPELAQLVRDHDALTGDYAASVRAGYRFWFHE